MFFFLIPLVGKTNRVNWQRVTALLAGTLRSLFNQTDANFRVIIAGQDRPDIPELLDPRVTFRDCALPHPAEPDVERADKDAKVRLLIREALAQGATAIARMDADDLLSRRLVQFFRENPHPTGYLYTKGYVWDYQSACIAPSDKVLKVPFHKRCGSCAIIAVDQARRELGNDLDALEAYMRAFGKHTEYQQNALAQGRPFGEIPFPAAIYVLNHGEGLAYRLGWKNRARDKRHARIRRYRINVTPEIRSEFALEGNFQSPNKNIFTFLESWRLFFSDRA